MKCPRITATATALALAATAGGCGLGAVRPEPSGVERTAFERGDRVDHPIPAPPPGAVSGMAIGLPASPPDLAGPRPVEEYIRRALDANRMVRASRSNVMALRERIPQVTTLDDPVLTNTFFPSADNGLQTADGFMPWNLLIAQQFPWFGTLALRGSAAELDVQVALAELAAAQLDAVAEVKRAYHDLQYNQRAEGLLLENRRLAEDFLEVARSRVPVGGLQRDVLQAEVALNDIDRELEAVRLGLAEARAALAQQLSISPETPLEAIPTPPPPPGWDAELDRLYRLAEANRPELRGRRTAVSRDLVGVELARKQSYPDVTLGFNYGLMTNEGAIAPAATGSDNLGMFVGFNLPVYRSRIAAGVREAQALASADAELVEAERDGTFREVKDLAALVGFQRRVLAIFREGNLPRARESFELTTSDYRAGTVDLSSVLFAWREVLQIELQIAQAEAELSKALASLERAVGVSLCEASPIGPDAPAALPIEEDDLPPPPPGPDSGGPFTLDEDREAAPGDAPRTE